METVFAMVILIGMVLGVIEISFALYGRNVVAASAHEGARAAIELGRSPSDAIAVASRTVRGSARGLVRGLDVSVSLQRSSEGSVVRVTVAGVLKGVGPIPLPIPVTSTATATSAAGSL